MGAQAGSSQGQYEEPPNAPTQSWGSTNQSSGSNAVYAKQVNSRSSTAWWSGSAAPETSASALGSLRRLFKRSRQRKKSKNSRPTCEVFLQGKGEPDMVLQDLSGDGRYDTVEHFTPKTPSGGPVPHPHCLPHLALDTSGNGKADTLIVDADHDGKYDSVLNKELAPLSFLVTMADSEHPVSPVSPVSSVRAQETCHLRGAAGTIEYLADDSRPLMPGWERVWSQTRQSFYYCNRETHRTTWDHSEAEVPTPRSPDDVRPLAPGWEIATSRRQPNRFYYYHAPSGRSSWDGDDAHIPYPSLWRNVNRKSHFLELVDGGSETFHNVQMLLSSTFLLIRTRDRKRKLPTSLEAVKIWRVENSRVFHQYAKYLSVLHETIEAAGVQLPCCDPQPQTVELLPNAMRRSLDSSLNEVYLFHGTSPAGASGIADSGFDIRRAAVNSCYGPGIYCAECSSKSDEYAQEDVEGLHAGHCAMLLCRVALGRVLDWPYAEFSPQLANQWAQQRHDSILGDRQRLRGTYREFVLPPESAMGVYPEFLIIYRRRYDDD